VFRSFRGRFAAEAPNHSCVVRPNYAGQIKKELAAYKRFPELSASVVLLS
jgi:hypothetical protein